LNKFQREIELLYHNLEYYCSDPRKPLNLVHDMPGILDGPGVMGLGDPNTALEALKEIVIDNDRLKEDLH
jgi:hypothetical protein